MMTFVLLSQITSIKIYRLINMEIVKIYPKNSVNERIKCAKKPVLILSERFATFYFQI